MKRWYLSKTLWVNLIAIIAIVLQGINSTWIIGPEIQGGILAIINVILRAVTGEPIAWSGSAPSDTAGPNNEAGRAEWPTVVLVLVLSLSLLMFSGCAGLRNNQDMATAGKALLTVKGSIVASAITTDRLCQAKTLSIDTCQQARDAYGTAKTAYDAAVDSYLLVQSGGGDPAAFAATLQRLESLAVNLAALAGGAQ